MNNLNVGMWKKLMAAALLVLLGIDRLIKFWAVNFLMPKGEIVIIPKIFSFTYTEASAASFGVMVTAGGFLTPVMLLILLIASIGILNLNESRKKYLSVSLSLMLTGLLSNVIDILMNGFIIGCFDIKGFKIPPGYRNIRVPPVFNLADLMFFTGLVLILLYVFVIAKKEAKAKQLEAEAEKDKPRVRHRFDD